MGKFFSGFLTGIIVLLLVLCIAFYVVFAVVPLSTIEGMFGIDLTPGEDNKNADKSIYEMGQLVIGTVTNLQATSLNDVKDKFGIDVISILKKSLGEDKNYDCLKDVMAAKLPDVFSKVKEIKTGDIMGLVGFSFNEEVPKEKSLKDILAPMLNASIQDMTSGTTNVFEDVINGITIGNLRGLDSTLLPSDVPMFEDNEVNNKRTLMDVMKGLQEGSAEPVTLGDVLKITDSSPLILKALKDEPVMKISTAINNFTLGDILEIDETNVNTPMILKALKGTKIQEISTRINSLKLNEIIAIDMESADTPQLLKTLANENVTTIDKTINNLTLGQVIDTTKSGLLTELKDTKISNIQTEMPQKVRAATLDKLKEWEMIDENMNLDKTIYGQRLGDMTLDDIMTYINNLPAT